MVGKLVKSKADGPVSALNETTELDKEAFKEILGKIDQGLRALPATAQVPCPAARHLKCTEGFRG